MTNHKEILRLHSLGISNKDISLACKCSRNSVTRVLQRAAQQNLHWDQIENLSGKEVSEKLFPDHSSQSAYRMPDYEYVHREMQKCGVTLSLLWIEYCEQCHNSGELPYKSTQFNKYYADYIQKTKATMHLNHKAGEVLQVDWAGQTAFIVDTDTGELIKAYIFQSCIST